METTAFAKNVVPVPSRTNGLAQVTDRRRSKIWASQSGAPGRRRGAWTSPGNQDKSIITHSRS